ncbi:hypothetical protein GX586_11285, partial [bacterium]|nr:hypothetical protein [bacterium]
MITRASLVVATAVIAAFAVTAALAEEATQAAEPAAASLTPAATPAPPAEAVKAPEEAVKPPAEAVKAPEEAKPAEEAAQGERPRRGPRGEGEGRGPAFTADRFMQRYEVVKPPLDDAQKAKIKEIITASMAKMREATEPEARRTAMMDMTKAVSEVLTAEQRESLPPMGEGRGPRG